MIQIHLNAARVEKILFVASSDVEEDYDFAAWAAIRPLVNQIDRRLQAIVKHVLSEQPQPGSPQQARPTKASGLPAEAPS